MQTLLGLTASLPIYLQLLIGLGAGLVVAALIVLILYPIMRAAALRTESFTLETFARRTRSSVFWILAMLFTVQIWSAVLNTAGEADETVAAVYDGWINLPRTLLYVAVGWFLIRCVGVAARTIRHRYNANDVNNLRERKILTQLQYIQKTAGIIIFILTVGFILMQFDEVRTLGRTVLSTAGVSGIIIGFAAQRSIANLLAGFQIAFTQPIRLDDVLIVNGEFGTVEEITLTYVTMKLWDQRRQIVPLNYFIDNIFQNWTRTNAELIGTVFLYLDYTFPVGELRAEVNRYLPTQELWDERVGAVAVTETSERGMTVRVLASSTNAGNVFTLRCNVREHLLNWVREHHQDKLPLSRTKLADPEGPIGSALADG